MNLILEVGKYYKFRDAIFLAKVCEFCPRNQHKVRERCDSEHGKVMTSLHFIGNLKSEQHPRLGQATFEGQIFECGFNQLQDRVYRWDKSNDTLNEAKPKEVAKILLGKI
jgi:hypothetical protein